MEITTLELLFLILNSVSVLNNCKIVCSKGKLDKYIENEHRVKRHIHINLGTKIGKIHDDLPDVPDPPSTLSLIHHVRQTPGQIGVRRNTVLNQVQYGNLQHPALHNNIGTQRQSGLGSNVRLQHLGIPLQQPNYLQHPGLNRHPGVLQHHGITQQRQSGLLQQPVNSIVRQYPRVQNLLNRQTVPNALQTGVSNGQQNLNSLRSQIRQPQPVRNGGSSTVDREEARQETVLHITDYFSYNPKSSFGPQHWKKIWPRCDGIYQSPININTSEVLYHRPYRIFYGDEVHRMFGEAVNNGHAPTFYVLPRSKALYGVPKMGNDVFVLYQIHLHFGNAVMHGSEHAIDMKYFPLEAHLVHYNYKYGSMKSAGQHRDGLAAISVLIEVDNKASEDSELDKFISRVMSQNFTPNITGISTMLRPSAVLPWSREFYTYFGSKTTPPCQENTRWIVMRETKTISYKTFQSLRMLRDNHGIPLYRYGNYRPIQLCNNRRIEANF